jgi:hypothetical protein
MDVEVKLYVFLTSTVRGTKVILHFFCMQISVVLQKEKISQNGAK